MSSPRAILRMHARAIADAAALHLRSMLGEAPTGTVELNLTAIDRAWPSGGARYSAHSQQGRNTWWVREGFVPSSCDVHPALCAGAPEDESVWRAMDAMVERDRVFQRDHPGQHPQPVRRKRGDKRPPCGRDGCAWKEGE